VSPEAPLRLEMRSNPAYLCGARELVRAVARQMGFGEEGCAQVALAVDEALCNVLRHGYERRVDGPVWVSVWPIEENGRPGGVRIVIEDEARQVEPEQIRGRDLDDIRPGGLGVHIIREVMDEVSYERRDGKGMRLTMVKRARGTAGCCRDGGQDA
jgi:anti-sigma regulatory factor (Ser/Thr protein kinase)